MTYNAKELSLYDSQPVELYEFIYATKVFRYTSADEQQSYLGNSYSPAPLRRGEIDQTQEINRADLKIEALRDFDVAEEFIIYPPAEVMLLRVYRQHRGDSETKLIWIGRVLNCEWSGGIATLTCEAVFTSLRRSGLRRTYGVQCQHALYGARCGVARNSYKATGTIASLSANVVTVLAAAAKPDGYFNGGMLTFLDVSGITHRRAITGHTGAVITLANAIRQLAETNSVDLFPGCDHTINDCHDKFDGNEENYSGMLHSPQLNPFDGKTLY
jgi:uncharacterized phage protein (TIGR02218 family)